MGIASLILGIVGLINAILVVLAPLGLILVIVGLILGIVDVVKKGKSGGKKGVGIAGIVICAIMLLVLIVENILVVGLGAYIFNEASEAISQADLSAQVVEAFNAAYEAYEGRQSGVTVKALISAINSHNIIDQEKTITCKLDYMTYDNATMRSMIDSSSQYNVRFQYDIDGYIDAVYITTISR